MRNAKVTALPTSRTASEKDALTKTVRRFQQLVSHAGDLVLQVSATGQVEAVLHSSGALGSVSTGEYLTTIVRNPDAATLKAWLDAAKTAQVPADLQVELAREQRTCARLKASPTPDCRRGSVLLSAVDETARILAEEKLRELASTDVLTGLPNRAHFEERLQTAVKRFEKDANNAFCVLMLDLDGFKKVNDSLGHPAGDALLQIASLRLKGCLRGEDLVARMSGDEFVALLPGVTTADRAMRAAMRLISAMRQPFVVDGQHLHLSASVGAVICPVHAQDAVTLLKFADAAMYFAKNQGKNRCAVYSNDLYPAVHHELELESAMHEAISQGEFHLVYQPIANRDGVVVGCEALMRWTRNDGSKVSPVEFIPMAERAGLITVLGEWALRAACQQLAKWREQLKLPLYVSVNVSPRQFRSQHFPETVRAALELAHLPPSALALEVTEGVLMEDPSHAKRLLGALADMGVRVCIDDFGTGYSSLAYLRDFRLDVLKLDQSFVRNMVGNKKDLSIATAILGLASELGLSVVAEGVESQEQMTILRDKGCSLFQGWLLGKPKAPDEFTIEVGPHGTAPGSQ